MTTQELARLFTPPNDKLAAARGLILKALTEEIYKANQLAATAGTKQRKNYEQWRNGLTRAQYIVRDLIDGQGKILRTDLEKYGLGPEEVQVLGE